MGCSNCGTTKGGKPSGCKSNGGCSTGGCNRLNVHDWLANLPFSDPESGCRIIEVSFNQGSRKDYYRNVTTQLFDKGDMVSVEGISGFDVGEVTLTGEIVRLQLKKKEIEENNGEIKKVLRRSSEKDLEIMAQNKARERDALVRSRAIARQLKLDMKMSEVEIQADGRKATFFYIADDRVDFRELIKLYAGEFRLKVEMRQIGARQEAAKVGGVGSCGRELCCSTWLSDFKSVNTTAARYQNLSINQSKLSGQCGRLKCCLNYELDTYLDALQNFPDNAETLQVAKGTATLIKKDIFKNLMWYVLPDSNKQYPLTIERVRTIRKMNMQNHIPDGLEPVEASTGKPKETENPFVDLVGQIDLKTLEKADRKKKHAQHNKQQAPNGRGVERNDRGAASKGRIPPLPPSQDLMGKSPLAGSGEKKERPGPPGGDRRREQRGGERGGSERGGGDRGGERGGAERNGGDRGASGERGERGGDRGERSGGERSGGERSGGGGERSERSGGGERNAERGNGGGGAERGNGGERGGRERSGGDRGGNPERRSERNGEQRNGERGNERTENERPSGERQPNERPAGDRPPGDRPANENGGETNNQS